MLCHILHPHIRLLELEHIHSFLVTQSYKNKFYFGPYSGEEILIQPCIKTLLSYSTQKFPWSLQLRTEQLVLGRGKWFIFSHLSSVFFIGLPSRLGQGYEKGLQEKIGQVLYDWWLICARGLNIRFLNWGSLGNSLNTLLCRHNMLHINTGILLFALWLTTCLPSHPNFCLWQNILHSFNSFFF